MSDSTEIHNLITQDHWDESLSSYKNSSLEYINDINNLSYASGQISFDTLSLVNKFTVQRDWFLAVPVNITSSGTAYTAASLIAWKQSILNFIYGIQVNTSSGQSIVNETQISLATNIRLLIEKDLDWYTQSAAGLMFQKDSIALATNNVGINNPTNTTASNTGFANRVGLLKQSSAFAANTFSTVLTIPLRYISDYFEQMNFPTVNNRIQINILINAYGNTTIAPMCVDSTPAPPPVITIGPATVPGTNVTFSTARLYYRSLEFSPELNQRLSSLLQKGFTKEVYFRVSDTYTPASGEVANTGGNISRVLNPSTIHPLRVWVITPGTACLSASGDGTHTGFFNSLASWTNANILIDNQYYYNMALNTTEEQWEVIKQQFPKAGSSNTTGGLISFSEFLSTYRFLCFDVSRNKNLQNPNKAVSIQVQATRTDTTSVDIYYVVERLQKVVLQMSAGETKFVIGLN